MGNLYLIVIYSFIAVFYGGWIVLALRGEDIKMMERGRKYSPKSYRKARQCWKINGLILVLFSMAGTIGSLIYVIGYPRDWISAGAGFLFFSSMLWLTSRLLLWARKAPKE